MRPDIDGALDAALALVRSLENIKWNAQAERLKEEGIEQIREMQLLLNRQGGYELKIDGIVGPLTKMALRTWAEAREP